MSERAIAFLADVVDRHGRRLDDVRIEIPLSQAELARQHDCSAGTVAYYLQRAGDIVISRRRQGLVVDRTALESALHPGPLPRSAAHSRHLRVAPTPPSPPPPVPGLSADQVVTVVSTLADCLTHVSSQLGLIADQLLAAVASQPANPATAASAKPRISADPATLADRVSLFSSGRKEENLPSFQANRTREIRDTEERSDRLPLASANEALPYDLVDELVAPLRALARQSGRPETLDNHGRDVLARLSEDQLRYGVAHVMREARADARIYKPLGLLVHRARETRAEFFSEPAPSRPVRVNRTDDDAQPTDEVDDEAVAAVVALEADDSRADELAALDEEVRAWLGTHVPRDSMQAVMWRTNRRGLRQAAWRRLQDDQAPVARAV
ncbi:MAG: hypothetical protein KY439_11455 [Actinobacteria bacterium]|nr:hypothetical protein [Actinomycetota bacterium]